MKLYFLVLSFVICEFVNAQKRMPIFIDVCNYYWENPTINDSIKLEARYNDSVFKLKVWKTTWKGAMSFQILSKNEVVILEGRYINSCSFKGISYSSY
jgi:hypothetical protein